MRPGQDMVTFSVGNRGGRKIIRGEQFSSRCTDKQVKDPMAGQDMVTLRVGDRVGM